MDSEITGSTTALMMDCGHPQFAAVYARDGTAYCAFCETRAEAERLAQNPYTIFVELDETTTGEPVHMAWVQELDGCFGQGSTIEETINDLRAAMEDYIESLLRDGLPVPQIKKG
jgi:predicted RNase H-like HicB family nuclease